MFSILYNGATIPLPNSDDFFAVFSEDDKMFTTDFELPITPQLVDVFSIRGILTQEDGEYFTAKQLPCTLQGFGVNVPCLLQLNSINQYPNTINISLTGLGLYGKDFYQSLTSDVIDACEYPLIYDNPQDNPLFAGIRINDHNILLNTPMLDVIDITRLVEAFNYTIEGLPANTLVIPNKIVMDARYKMRRVYFKRNVIDTSTVESYVVKGEYYNLNDDKITVAFNAATEDRSCNVINSFTTEEFTQAMRIYYALDFIGYENTHFFRSIEVTITGDTPFELDGTPATVMGLNSYTADKTLNYTLGDRIESNYFEMSNFASGHYTISINIDISNSDEFFHTGFVSLQYVFKDDCVGVRQITGNLDDETVEIPSYASHVFSTSSFNTCGYGLRPTIDYSGEITTRFRTDDDGFELVKYNDTSALMVTNKYACFDGVSIIDILKTIALQCGKMLCINKIDQKVVFINDISTAISEEPKYLYYNKIEFDDSYAVVKKASFVNREVKGDDALDTGRAFVKRIEMFNPFIDMNYFDTSGNLVEIPFGQCYIANHEGNVPFYDLSMSIFSEPKALLDTNLCVFNSDAKGWFVVFETNDYNADGLSRQEAVDQQTMLDRGQVITAQVIGYVNTSFLTYQTRTFRVLEQELSSNGTNEVKLLLYC